HISGGTDAGTGAHGTIFSAGDSSFVRLHVHGARGAVRIVHSPDHDLADIAAGYSVRHCFAAGNWSDGEHLFRPRAAASVRCGEEERDSSDRSHERFATAGHGTF